MKYQLIFTVRNYHNPSDSIRFVCHFDDLGTARSLFSLNGNFISPDDLFYYLTARQYSRFSAYYNRPRYCSECCFWVDSYKALN